MRTKPTAVDPVVAFRSKHEQLQDVYYFVDGRQLVTVQVREISRSYLRHRRRAAHIDDLANQTVIQISRSIEQVAKGCHPAAQHKHLAVGAYGYRWAAACGAVVGRRADTLAEVDCPTCLIRMYQTSIANPLTGKQG